MSSQTHEGAPVLLVYSESGSSLVDSGLITPPPPPEFLKKYRITGKVMY
jgi:hypothetical protein